MKCIRAAALLAGLLFPCCLATAQAHRHTSTSQAARPTSSPYAGDLSIFEYPDRDKKLQVNRVMELLAIQPGSTVADIGAGSGWFSVRAARRVGPHGTVFAEDINPAYISYIDDRARKESLTNVHTILGSADDPKLPAATPTAGIDAVLLLKVYHEIAHPIPVMRLIRASLKPGGRVGIIDRNGIGTDHGLDHKVVEKEMIEAGYKLDASYDFTKTDGQDYFLIFIPTTSFVPPTKSHPPP